MTQVVADYYAAMNAHSVDRALSFLHPRVMVTFPEEGGGGNSRKIAQKYISEREAYMQ